MTPNTIVEQPLLEGTLLPWTKSGVRRRIGKTVYHAILAGPEQVDIAGFWFNEQTGEGFADYKLAVRAPDLARENAALRSALEAAAEQADNIAATVAGCASAEGDPHGVLEMVHSMASEIAVLTKGPKT